MTLNKSGLFLVLFGLVFFGFGAGMGYLSGRTLSRAKAVRGWTERPAQVESCELSVSRGSKGGSTYEAKATYRYEVNGVGYSGARVSLHSGSDNVGDFQRRTYEELKRGRDGVEATVCWVNPANPAEAILIRKVRPEILAFMQLFVLAFGGAGLGVVLAGLGSLLQPSAQSEPSAGMGQIRMRGASTHRIALALALAWNGYVGWFLWQSWQVLAPEPLPWPLWLMAVSGLIPAGVAGYLVGRFRKFGVSIFEMSPLPGVLGGPVNGTIRIPVKVETGHGFEIVLQCIHQYASGSGKSRTTHRDVQWEDSRHIDGALAYGDETMLPVRFAVPYDRPATTVPGGSNGHYWQLKASAAAPGIDYKAVFDVPVRHTPQSSPAFVPQSVPDTGLSPEPVDAVIGRAGLRLEPRADGGFELVFPAGRPRSAALFLSVFAAAWTAVCAVLWTVSKAPAGLALFFTALDGVLLWGLFQAVFVTRGAVVDRAKRLCSVWWRAPGFPKRARIIPFDEIMDIRSERAGQSGNTVYYRIALVSKGGSPATVGSGMTMWNDAEDIAKLLRAAVSSVFERAGFRV